MSALAIDPVEVAVDDGKESGVLVSRDNILVGVLVRLSHPMYLHDTGRWYLEAGFGPCAARPETFGTLEEALRWVAGRLRLNVETAVAAALAGFRPASDRR